MTELEQSEKLEMVAVSKQSTLKMRLRALLVLGLVGGLIGVSIYLDPAELEKPFAHHYSWLKPCGFLVSTGYPCPTCYMTRAFAYTFHGRPDIAFMAQPFGALLAILVVYLGYGATRVLISGRPWQAVWAKWSRKWLLLGFIAAFMGGWIFRVIYGIYVTHEFPLR
jgi:hypothetical protein